MEWIDAVAEWVKLNADLAVMGAREKELRRQIFAGTFPQPKEGMNTFVIPHGASIGPTVFPYGAKLKADNKVNRKILAPVFDALSPEDLAALTKFEVIVFKPDIRVGKYKEALQSPDPALKKLVLSVVEESPGMPQLTLEPNPPPKNAL